MEGAIIMTVIMIVPIAAIISNAILKAKKLELEKLQSMNGSSSFTGEEKDALLSWIKQLKEQNNSLVQTQKELEDRIQKMEQKMLNP